METKHRNEISQGLEQFVKGRSAKGYWMSLPERSLWLRKSLNHCQKLS